MDINKFIEKFAEQFDDINATSLTSSTKFRDLDDWSSIIALSIIAMVDEEYNVTLKGDDIRKSNTIEDIYNIVVSRIN